MISLGVVGKVVGAYGALDKFLPEHQNARGNNPSACRCFFAYCEWLFVSILLIASNTTGHTHTFMSFLGEEPNLCCTCTLNQR